MQAITIAIGQSGIKFFAQALIADKLINLVSQMVPPNKQIDIGTISIIYSSANNVVINLTQGQMVNLSPTFQGISQQDNGTFTLGIQASNFNAQYNWDETYQYISCSFVAGVGVICQPPTNKENKFNYSPAFSQLQISVPLAFTYDSQSNSWNITTGTSSGSATASSANIPSNSIIQEEDQSCFSSHVDDATAQSISQIDFSSLLNALISNLIASIPGSGNLGNGIMYDFSLGDSKLLFPHNDGIQMGIKGGGSYNGTPFSGDKPPSLPLPAPLADSDTHHLNMYVSNYEIDALTWAFTQAGKLNMVLNPTDIPDPDVLKVKTYSGTVPALKPYQYFAMQAQVKQNSAPVTAFQTVYQFTTAVMTTLQNQLPGPVFQLLNNNIAGNNYASQSDLEANLQGIGVNSSDFAAIEAASKTMGMVVNHDINYTLVIQTSESPQPTIVFNVTRVDILGDLSLGINTNLAQTMKFSFSNATWTCTFVSSSIPGFNGGILDSIWGQAGESGYATIMDDLGGTGVPVPIMQGFQFDFANAVLSLQEGYVSILSNVSYKSS